MRSRLSLLLLVLAALCISTAHAATTLKYQYRFKDDDGDATSAANADDPFVNPAYNPSFDLGILQAGWSIKISLNIPNIGTGTLL